jgi:hypothetical protein
MAWISITAADLKTRFAGAEYNSVTAAALNTGQAAADLVTEEISSAINEVRGYIPPNVPRGEDGTIPDELKRATLALIVYAILTRLPNLKSLLDERRVAAYADALELLKQCASGKFRVTPPETEAPAAEQATTQTIRRKETPARDSRSDFAGL